MASYMVLTIDTKNPTVEIYAPSYTTKDVMNTITIEADEPIANYQDIYVIDSSNQRHDYTFEKVSDNQYVGRVRFNTMPLGVATIYARVKDEVENYSNIAMKTFEIKDSIHKGNISISDKPLVLAKVSDKEMINAKVRDYKGYEVKVSDKGY
jgi:hypothetical protein